MARLENGVFDAAYLVPLESEGDYLFVEPATQLVGYAGRQWISLSVMENLRAAAKEWRQRTGNPLRITEGWRSLETQREYKRRQLAGTGGPAATPGYSNHGLGLALDMGSAIGWGGAPYAVWADIASRHGFSNAEGLRVGEKWHWVGAGVPIVAGDGDITPIEEEDPDMAFTKDQADQLAAIANSINDPTIGILKRVNDAAASAEAAAKSAQAAANSAEAARLRIGADLDGRLGAIAPAVWGTAVTEDGKSASGVLRQTWERSGDSSKRASTLIAHVKVIAAKVGAVLRTDLPE